MTAGQGFVAVVGAGVAGDGGASGGGHGAVLSAHVRSHVRGRHTTDPAHMPKAHQRCGIGSSGGRCLSLGDYVTVTGPRDGATAAGGANVAFALSAGSRPGCFRAVSAASPPRRAAFSHL